MANIRSGSKDLDELADLLGRVNGYFNQGSLDCAHDWQIAKNEWIDGEGRVGDMQFCTKCGRLEPATQKE